MPEDGPQADTTQSPSPLVAMLWTLMPGPGDHFDFVLMHANSEVPANDLLTTQSEADPALASPRFHFENSSMTPRAAAEASSAVICGS
jgi:hypothetical protein